MEWVLNNNVFLFQDKIFKQCKGMGASFAQEHICLFLSRVPTIKEKIVCSYLRAYKEDMWLRKTSGSIKCVLNTCNHFKTEKKYNQSDFINCHITFVVYCLSCPRICFYAAHAKRRKHQQIFFIKNNVKECVKSSIRGGDRLCRLFQMETLWLSNLMQRFD